MVSSFSSGMGIDGDESYNPWDNTVSRSLGNALLLAEKTGYIRRFEVDTEKLEEETQQKLPSLKLISLLREIRERRNEYNQVMLEAQRRMLERETRDITNLQILDCKIKDINELNSYLQHIISGKEFLTTRLQQPFVGEFLKLEANYHKFASELFPQVATTLAELTTHIDTVDWAVSADLSHENFDTVLNRLTTCLFTMQSHFQSLSNLRRGMNQLFKQRETTPSLHSH